MLDLDPIHHPHPQAHPTPPPRPKQAISIQTITSLVIISHVYDKKVTVVAVAVLERGL